MAGTKKRLVADLEEKDVIILDRPEVEITKIEDLGSLFRQSPKGKVLHVKTKKGAFKDSEDKILLLDEDKVDTYPRPSKVSKLWSWVKKASTKVKKTNKNEHPKGAVVNFISTDPKDMPPIMKPQKE